MTTGRCAAALAGGLLLAALPFLHYTSFGVGVEPHGDHEPRYGGQLGMVGDHHIELRRRGGAVEAFVSDAWRRPVRPRTGWVLFDRTARIPLQWNGHHLAGDDWGRAQIAEAHIILDDGTNLSLSFDWSEPPIGRAKARPYGD